MTTESIHESISIAPVPPFAALIFDCDGTLADTLPLQFQAWLATLKPYGIELVWDWYSQHCGLSSAALVQRVSQEFTIPLDPDIVRAEKRRQYQQLIPLAHEINAVTDIVRSHWGKVPMAVASGGDRANVEGILHELELKTYFDAIVCVNDVGQGKPAPDLLLLAAQQLNVSPADCILYEDSEEGLEAAQRAGMRSIDVRVLRPLS
jgi:HAD superfamily hydrolase (TIGR01509 family)